jgi:uncharacterized protein (TIGR02996 family)
VTTEDDFQAALDENPEDWQTRLVFADWLDERGDERGPGYRALGLQRHRPPRGNGYVWFNAANYGRITFENLPADWFHELFHEKGGGRTRSKFGALVARPKTRPRSPSPSSRPSAAPNCSPHDPRRTPGSER